MAQRVKEREQIPVAYRWKTQHLFRSDKAWQQARHNLLARLPALKAQQGSFKKGGKVAVLACLEQLFSIRRDLSRLASYADRKYDEDTRVSRYQGLREVAEKARAEVRASAAFVEPELLLLPAKTLRALIEDEDLSDYSFFLQEILRRKPHVLSPKEETLLASTQLMQDAGHNTYSAFSGAELELPEIEDERGKRVRLTQALFSRYRRSPDRRVRKDAFDATFGTFGRYRATFASMLSSQVNAHIVFAKARRYQSALDAALDPNGLKASVYQTMVEGINDQLPLLHRYLRLRKRMLGLRSLAYSDLYAPLNKGLRWRFPYDKGRAVLVEAMAPLGKRYCRDLERGLDPAKGWVDVYPNAGKRSGAYMCGSAYDVHPFVLANYLDDYNSLSTMAHEMGHAMHSYYSNRRQPYAKADYTIFVAEVASTLNEALLMEHLLSSQSSAKRRLFLLGEQLEGFRQTMFRQALFAEFELAVYQRAEAGEALTADALSESYLAITRRYYGHDAGVVNVAPQYAMEWAYIPHFYYNFYVFQYVTGMAAALGLAEGIRVEGKVAAERYIEELLSAGDSRPSLEILRRAGVDLEDKQTYGSALQGFERALDQIEELL